MNKRILPVHGWKITIADKIRFYIGDALELVPCLGVTFDMALLMVISVSILNITR